MPEAEPTQSSPSPSPSPSPSASQASPAAAASAAQTTPATTQATQAPSAAAPQSRPEWAPDRYWDAAKNELKGADLRKDFDSLAAFKAAEDSRKLTLPQTPDGYKVETTANFKPPEGVEWKLDADDPAWGVAKSVAHKYGVPQAALSEFADAFAGFMVGDAAKMQNAKNAEIAKLGGAGPARVDAVTQWLTSIGGDKFAGLANVLKHAPLASTVEGVEHLMQQFSSQGGGSYGAGKRDPGVPDGKIPGYDGMTFEQRRHAQEVAKQQSGRRAG